MSCRRPCLDFVLPTRKSVRKMVAEFPLTCYKDMTENFSKCKYQRATQCHTYHDRLDDGDIMLHELGIDEQRN